MNFVWPESHHALEIRLLVTSLSNHLSQAREPCRRSSGMVTEKKRFALVVACGIAVVILRLAPLAQDIFAIFLWGNLAVQPS